MNDKDSSQPNLAGGSVEKQMGFSQSAPAAYQMPVTEGSILFSSEPVPEADGITFRSFANTLRDIVIEGWEEAVAIAKR